MLIVTPFRVINTNLCQCPIAKQEHFNGFYIMADVGGEEGGEEGCYRIGYYAAEADRDKVYDELLDRLLKGYEDVRMSEIEEKLGVTPL